MENAEWFETQAISIMDDIEYDDLNVVSFSCTQLFFMLNFLYLR